MKKEIRYYGMIWLILVLAFHLVVFLSPVKAMDGAFWVGYAFIMLAFIGQAACSYLFFYSNSREQTFLKLPLVTISYTGLILSVVIGLLCMVTPNFPIWLGVVIALLILSFYAIAVIKACAAAKMVENVDNKVKTRTFFVGSLTADLETLGTRVKDEALKTEIDKLTDVCRYSDPMSGGALSDIEGQITLKFHALQKAVADDSADAARIICQEMNILFADRNKRCKLLK